MVPKPGTDDAHDAGLEAMKEAEASLEDERKKWAAELGDRTIEFWTPQVRGCRCHHHHHHRHHHLPLHHPRHLRWRRAVPESRKFSSVWNHFFSSV